MRVFHVDGERASELAALPEALPARGYLWLGVTRREFEADLQSGAQAVQGALQRLAGGQLVDLHVADLLNRQLPSHFDYTSWYDLLVFRRLSASAAVAPPPMDDAAPAPAEPPWRRIDAESIDTSAVGFALFDRLLLTVHPSDCQVLDHFSSRLTQTVPNAAEPRLPNGSGSHLATEPPPRQEPRSTLRTPASPADLMLRMVNHMVDGYLALRRLLTRQLTQLQQALFDARSHFDDWSVLLDLRNALHLLEDTCEDQRSAMVEWLDALDEWPPEPDAALARERELLRVRSRDVLEHIERVIAHVRRLEGSAESAVQMHFSALGNRTNDIMRTLTVLTAIFLPLNLITGIFGMNFDKLPLIHARDGFWLAVAAMGAVAVGLVALFRRKRYLAPRR